MSTEPHPCWICQSPEGRFWAMGAATPVYCNACYSAVLLANKLGARASIAGKIVSGAELIKALKLMPAGDRQSLAEDLKLLEVLQ